MRDSRRLGSRKPRKSKFILGVTAGILVLAGLWLALRAGPPPAVLLESDQPALGRVNKIVASFVEPDHGLSEIRLELVQGDRIEVLDEERFKPGSVFPWSRAGNVSAAALDAVIGTDSMDWLVEGEVVVRAVAGRSGGWLRPSDPVVVEKSMPVRLRPPRIELLSSQHYGRQGGSGLVVYSVGPNTVRSGVWTGGRVSLGSHLPEGNPDKRFALFALPWDLFDEDQIRIFAQDDAGNWAEIPFLDSFISRPERVDMIRLSDSFFERVVPAIASRTPGFDDSPPLLDQYLFINRDLRQAELDRVDELSHLSQPALLWSGPFVQMANSELRAGFAETRSYVYDEHEVDRQTHLGLDLASTARAPVPAPNSGRVVFAGWMTLYGNAVIIDHGYGLMSLCGHLSTIEAAEGELVERGQIIGLSGATGLAGGDHLHLEIFVHGQSVDPIEWLDGKWVEEKIMSKLD